MSTLTLEARIIEVGDGFDAIAPAVPHVPVARFDNRHAWDNKGGSFDNRPGWDNWNKR